MNTSMLNQQGGGALSRKGGRGGAGWGWGRLFFEGGVGGRALPFGRETAIS